MPCGQDSELHRRGTTERTERIVPPPLKKRKVPTLSDAPTALNSVVFALLHASIVKCALGGVRWRGQTPLAARRQTFFALVLLYAAESNDAALKGASVSHACLGAAGILRGSSISSLRPVMLRLPPLSWVAPCGAALVSLAFILAYWVAACDEPPAERLRWPYVFPSSALNYSPASNVGAALGGVGLVVVSWALLLRFVENHARLAGRLSCVNAAALVGGSAGLVVTPLCVYALPWHEFTRTHDFFGYATFYLGISSLGTQAWLDAQPPVVASGVRFFRLALLGAGLIAMFVYWLLFGVVGQVGHTCVYSASCTYSQDSSRPFVQTLGRWYRSFTRTFLPRADARVRRFLRLDASRDAAEHSCREPAD